MRVPAERYMSLSSSLSSSLSLSLSPHAPAGGAPPLLVDTQRRCLALLVATLTGDDEAAAPLRAALGMGVAETERLASPLLALRRCGAKKGLAAAICCML